MTVAEALAHARARGLDRLDAQLLLGHVCRRSRTWLLAHGDATIAAETATRLLALVERRSSQEPLAYLLGEKEFHGLALQVDARVLVPRPETELLVDWALEFLQGELAHVARPTVIDLGTGSGAIALAIKHAHPAADVHAVDLSAAALEVASGNAARLGLAVQFGNGSWWDALPDLRVDIALANPPYIAGADPHLRALRHEPSQALTPGASGLEAITAIVDAAAAHLKPGGWLLLEHGFDQADAVVQRLASQGFGSIATRRDLAGHARCTGGKL